MPGDLIISDPSIDAAPKETGVPAGSRYIVKQVQALFTDNGATGAWLPTLEIVSDAGIVTGRYVGSSVAAGADQEVTFHPLGRGAAASTPVTTAGLPWAFVQRTSVVVPNFVAVTTGVDFDLALGPVSGFSSDAAIFTVGAAVGGGLHGIKILAEGQYLWTATAFATMPAPPAGATSAIRTSWDNGDLWVGQYVSPFVVGPGAAVAQTQPSLVEQFNLKAGGTAPPQSTTLFLSQNTGGNLTFVQPTLAVFQLSPIGTLDFT